jgi:hypothetical protein
MALIRLVPLLQTCASLGNEELPRPHCRRRLVILRYWMYVCSRSVTLKTERLSLNRYRRAAQRKQTVKLISLTRAHHANARYSIYPANIHEVTMFVPLQKRSQI